MSDRDYYMGVLFSLSVLKSNINCEVAALDLAGNVGGIKMLEKVARKSNCEQDLETIEWLKEIGNDD